MASKRDKTVQHYLDDHELEKRETTRGLREAGEKMGISIEEQKKLLREALQRAGYDEAAIVKALEQRFGQRE